MTPGLLLHIGLPKTGTTTLQRTVFPRHSQLFFLGKFVKSTKVSKGCRTERVHELCSRLLWNTRGDFDVSWAQQVCQEEILSQVGDGLRIVGSWESLGNRSPENHRRILERVLRIFGSCRIMVTLRNPLTQVPSNYLQSVEGKFINGNRKWMGPTAALSLDEWFSRCRQKNRGALLNYADNIRVSIEMLGRENVGVFLFEDLASDPHGYYAGLSRFIGIDEEECCSLSEKKHFNTRLSSAQLELTRSTESSVWRRGISRRMTRRGRRLLLKGARGDSSPAREPLTDSLREELVAMTTVGNRWLMDELGLPLKGYGYPC